MLVRDDRIYAFIVARASRSRSHIRRIAIHKHWIKFIAVVAAFLLMAVVYGFYGLVQQTRHILVETENTRLRRENAKQRMQLEKLNNRVEAVEDASRRLVEMSGADAVWQSSGTGGTGGPALPMNDIAINLIESKTGYVEKELQAYEVILRERSVIPSIWPVKGTLESGFGGRRNPFGGSSYEYHEGQDIDAAFGAPVNSAANGTVVFAGWQNGYGQVVYVDHGGGLSTRYGHLSKIEVAIGQTIARGEVLGLVGSSGRSTGPHLHYEVRMNNEPVDPIEYLPIAN
jgi:murein DD-endopeptidase MepM/ murein hydrolase activator NlpD